MNRMQHHRRGISLIEVIACTAIVAVMIVPIASVLRSSAGVIDRNSRPDSDASVRTAVRWMRDTVNRGQITAIGRSNINFVDAIGRPMQLVNRGGELVMTDGTTWTSILRGVRSFQTQQLVQSSPPGEMIGVSAIVAGVDPDSGQTFNQAFSIATPTQF